MNNIYRLGVAVLVFFLMALIFKSESTAAVLKEKNVKIKKIEAEGRITGGIVTVQEANGGPIINKFRTDYPAQTILKVAASLSVNKGIYRVELLNDGKPSMTLSAESGKPDRGVTDVGVDEKGDIAYRVLAKKAGDVVLELSFVPVSLPVNSRTSQTSLNEKTVESGDGLTLILNCTAGKKCVVQARNQSKAKAYKKIEFEIEYQMMTGEATIEKIKNGIIEDVLFPNKTQEWTIGLVFGEPPRSIKIKLLAAEVVDPAAILTHKPPQTNNDISLNTVSEKVLGK